MDEPTNHLDMETVDALAKALERFKVIVIAIVLVLDPGCVQEPINMQRILGDHVSSWFPFIKCLQPQPCIAYNTCRDSTT